MSKKYHVALSFAGEDRTYVGQVADALQTEGVDVFYDKFEEANLWGKDLQVHLSDIYQNRAVYTVIFISEAYRKKQWTNHERKSAQARAFSENQEYILPAFFDESIEMPGLLKTVGYIGLRAVAHQSGSQPAAAKQFAHSFGVNVSIRLRFPTKPAGYSRAKSAMHSNLIAATLLI